MKVAEAGQTRCPIPCSINYSSTLLRKDAAAQSYGQHDGREGVTLFQQRSVHFECNQHSLGLS